MSGTGLTSTPPSASAVERAPSSGLATERSRRLDVDYSKAFAIVLVVIGHVSDPAGPAWAQNLKAFIYNFHMPLFMYLSGYVFFLHAKKNERTPLRSYIHDRGNRLLTVFIVFYLLVMNIKFFAGGFTEVRRSGFSYLDGLQYMFLHTQMSPALDLWYLVTLFVFSVATFACLRVYKHSLYGLLFISLFMYAVFAATEQTGGITDNFYIDRFCWFYVFFMLGCVISQHWTTLRGIFEQLWAPALLLFLLYQAAMFYDQARFVSGWRFLIAGGLSIVAVHGFASAHLQHRRPILQILADNTLAIYLLNSIVIGAAMPALKHILRVHTDMAAFYGVLVPLGLLVPIAIRFGLKKVGTPNFYMRYIT